MHFPFVINVLLQSNQSTKDPVEIDFMMTNGLQKSLLVSILQCGQITRKFSSDVQEIKAPKLLFHGKGVTSNPSTKINMIVGSNIVDDVIF